MALLIGLVAPLQSEFRELIVPMPKLSACTPVGAKAVYHLSDLPPEAVVRLNRIFKEGFADAGAAFNSTDVTSDHSVPQRRFSRGYQHGNKQVVWYEHGGRGYHVHALGTIKWPGQTGLEVSPFAWFGGGNVLTSLWPWT
jgi:hypothetical protein